MCLEEPILITDCSSSCSSGLKHGFSEKWYSVARILANLFLTYSLLSLSYNLGYVDERFSAIAIKTTCDLNILFEIENLSMNAAAMPPIRH